METNYARAIRITWIITGLCLIAFLTMWLMSNFGIDWRKDWFFLVFSIPMFLLCIITLPVLYQYRGKQISGMKDIAAGKELARWTYDEQA
ncbi:MAG: hypothetical protein HY966_07275, partial [Ignavibacteriales bacterium]|nr:hypothetical protein [Ignavibacteriales bacterium]